MAVKYKLGLLVDPGIDMKVNSSIKPTTLSIMPIHNRVGESHKDVVASEHSQHQCICTCLLFYGQAGVLGW